MTKSKTALYHYTSRNGFLEIVGKHQLWATNILYLNDSEEFQYVFNLLKEILPNYRGQKAKRESIFIDKIDKSINNVNNLLDRWPVYVVSFSEKSDLLSQWRGYCGNGSGICIGFKVEHLSMMAEKNKFYLSKCIYTKQTQIRKIKELISDHVAKLKNSDTKEDEVVIAVLRFYRELFKEAPFFKHPSFKQEEEWRLVVSEFLNSKEEEFSRPVKYRDGISMIVPYIEVDFKIGDSDIEFNEIIVGPSPHKDLSRASVWSFLENTEGVNFADVVSSKIPYRSW